MRYPPLATAREAPSMGAPRLRSSFRSASGKLASVKRDSRKIGSGRFANPQSPPDSSNGRFPAQEQAAADRQVHERHEKSAAWRPEKWGNPSPEAQPSWPR